MPQINRHTINTTLWQNLWGRVAEVLSFQRKLNRQQQASFWGGLLTPTEKVMFAKRITANLLLLSGWSETQIAEYVKLSRSTIYKWSDILQRDKEYQSVLKKLLQKPIPTPEKTSPQPDHWVLNLIDDILSGYRHRSRLYSGTPH